MSGTVNNGRRVQASFGRYSTPAGLRERDGVLEVALRGELRHLRDLAGGTVDGELVLIESVAKSDWVAGMVVVTCRPAPADAPEG